MRSLQLTRKSVGFVFVLSIVAGRVAAQDRPVELGLDGAISFTFVSSGDGQDVENVQTWAFPLRRIRVGVYPVRVLQAQISSGFEVADYGGVSTVRFTLGLAGVYQLPVGTPKRGPYVAIGGGIDYLSDDGSDLQWSAAGGAGYRMPLGRSVSLRPALEVVRSFASGDRNAETSIAGLVGLSFFID